MVFNCDEEVKKYVNREISKVNDKEKGTLYAHIRPQWKYSHLSGKEMDIGHLEWKICWKCDIFPKIDTNDDSEIMFSYWSLLVTSDYRLFIFTHSNSSAGPWHTGKSLMHCSIIYSEDLYDGALSEYITYIINTFSPNQYFLS